uniref:Uncharacterized protein n=1 Tax=Arundo donax TaxID=35708 RepID=A0A0A9DWJ5_ARUDO
MGRCSQGEGYHEGKRREVQPWTSSGELK